MIRFSFLFLLLTQLSFAHVRTGQFKGHIKLSQQMNQRIFSGKKAFNLSYYLNSAPLNQLLGDYQEVAGFNKFVGGDANGINALLYRVGLDMFCQDVQKICEGTQQANPLGAAVSFEFNQSFIQASKALCEKPQNQVVLTQFYQAVMGLEYPQKDLMAYIDFWHKSPAKVHELCLGVVLNPLFLLER